jgi:hypothetical protein
MIEQPEPQHSPEELAAIELRHQLAGLGPDTDRALMVTLRLPNGQFVADIWLSRKDVEVLSDVCVSIAAYRDCSGDIPTVLHPDEDAGGDGIVDLTKVTDDNVTDFVTAVEQLLKAEGGE